MTPVVVVFDVGATFVVVATFDLFVALAFAALVFDVAFEAGFFASSLESSSSSNKSPNSSSGFLNKTPK